MHINLSSIMTLHNIPAMIACLAFANAAGAQEASPELRADIAQWMAMQTADSIHSATGWLGKAFEREIFLNHYRTTLINGKETEKPEETECPAAIGLASRQIHYYDGDYDSRQVLAALERELARPEPEEDARRKEWKTLYNKLQQTYRPLLEQREINKEEQLLKLNASRPEVTTLPNGVQVECEPGNAGIRDITRGTSETGVAFYTRVTNDMDFDDLPESVKQMADKLPQASSWTFYIPAQSEQAVRDARLQQKKQLEQQRQEKLQKLIDARIKSYPKEPEPEQKTDHKQHTPLLKLKVWKDDPQHPVNVLPDVTENVI